MNIQLRPGKPSSMQAGKSRVAKYPKRTWAARDCCRAKWPLNPIPLVANPCCNYAVGVVPKPRGRRCDDAISSKELLVRPLRGRSPQPRSSARKSGASRCSWVGSLAAKPTGKRRSTPLKRVWRKSAGNWAAISNSTIAGRGPSLLKWVSLRTRSSQCDPILWSVARHRPRPSCSTGAFLLSSCWWPIQSVRASCKTWGTPAVVSPDSPFSKLRSAANGSLS